MDFKELTNLIKNKKKTISIIVAIFVLLAMIITFAQPLKYRATTRLLVVQEGSAGSDVYSISRSNKYLSSILSEVVYSNTFFEQVLESNFNIDKSVFSLDLNKRMKQWKKMVSSNSISDTGMIVINVYHPNRYQASQINQAIAYTLRTKNSDYHGLKDKVSVKTIDRTTLSNWPVKPNILLNLFLGLVFGFLVGLGFVKLYPEKELRILPVNIWPKKKRFFQESYASEAEEGLESYKEREEERLEPVPVMAYEDKLEAKEEENNFLIEDVEEEKEDNFDFEGDIKNVF